MNKSIYAILIIGTFFAFCSNKKSITNKTYCCIRLEFVGLSGGARLTMILKDQRVSCLNCNNSRDDPIVTQRLEVDSSSIMKIAEIIKARKQIYDGYDNDTSGYAAILISEGQNDEVYPFLEYSVFVGLINEMRIELKQEELFTEFLNNLHEQDFRE